MKYAAWHAKNKGNFTKVQPKFLIVDDQHSFRLYVQTLLAEFNAEFSEAENGEKAISLIAAQKFDLILLDINMPGISGLEACARIRQELGFHLLPIIIITSMDTKETVPLAFAAGATDYVSKTLSQFELVPRVRAIMDRHHAEHEMYRARKEAEIANQAKSNFLTSMSHELRTPLNAILGFSQLLESDPDNPLNPMQKESIEYISKAGWYLLALINEILDLAKIEAGRVDLSIKQENLGEIIDECINIIHPLAVKRAISIINRALQEAVRIKTDRTRLKQVLMNLLNNAVKYNRERGYITILAEKRDSGKVRISITDTGQGLSPDEVGSLFQSFNRLGAEKTEIEGTGVGLVISKKLVELMGGSIGVESLQDMGSTFWIELDIFHASVQESRLAPDMNIPQELGKPTRHLTVLYIEDNPVNLRLVAQMLARRDDINMLSAHNGRLGIDLAMAHRLDVILLDINLPGMDGYEVLRKLKSHDETRNVPCLAISAHAMPEDIEKGLAAGFFNYLTKPLDVGRLFAAIDNALHEQVNYPSHEMPKLLAQAVNSIRPRS